MLFWIVAGCLAAAVAVAVARPILRPADEASPDAAGAVYRDQLAEVERDLARGTLPPAEAERARAEVARRLLALSPARAAADAPPRAAMWGAAGAGVVLVAGSLALYAYLGAPDAADAPRAARLAAAEALRDARPSQAEAEALAPPVPLPDVPAGDLALLEELRAAVPSRGDAQGWLLLAREEARVGRYAEAARAQGQALALLGADAPAEARVAQVDLLVAATGGAFVSPEAEAALAALPPDHPARLYYAGLAEAQVGRYDRAFPLWRAVAEGAADGIHRRLARAQVAEAAARAGVDYAPPEDEDDAIRGMVEGLQSRLAAEGGSPEEWARLVTSLAVLGDGAGAADALARGRAAHPGATVLDEAAASAGLQ